MITGEPCFLDSDEWKAVLSSAVLEYTTFSYCSESLVSLFLRIVGNPRLFNDVQTAIRFPEYMTTKKLSNLVARVDHARSGLKVWRDWYDNLTRAIDLEAPERLAMDQFDRRMESLGVYLANITILNRLACALRPEMGLELEDETQGFARQIFSLEQSTATNNPRAYVFLAFKLFVANATRETELEWRQTYAAQVEDKKDPCRPIAWPVFERWIRLKGRNTETVLEVHQLSKHSTIQQTSSASGALVLQARAVQ